MRNLVLILGECSLVPLLFGSLQREIETELEAVLETSSDGEMLLTWRALLWHGSMDVPDINLAGCQF